MTAVLVTGMSGTGKSSVLQELSRRGFRVVDTDTDEWCEWTTAADGSPDWVWREDRMAALLAEPSDGALFVAGCKTNQGAFYDRFDEVVLLHAPIDMLKTRIATRDTNDYGKTAEQLTEILSFVETVEPLLAKTSTAEIDTSGALVDVADELVRLADRHR